jgi:hypothetical protein
MGAAVDYQSLQGVRLGNTDLDNVGPSTSHKTLQAFMAFMACFTFTN